MRVMRTACRACASVRHSAAKAAVLLPLAVLTVLMACRPSAPPALLDETDNITQIVLAVDADVPAGTVDTLSALLGAPVRYVNELEYPVRVRVLGDSLSLARRGPVTVLVPGQQPGDPVAAWAQQLVKRSGAAPTIVCGGPRYGFVEVGGALRWLVQFEHQAPGVVACVARRLRDDVEAWNLAASEQRLRRRADRAVSDLLRKRHGFELAVPETYTAHAENAAWPAAVEFSCMFPARVVTVYWLDGVAAEQAQRSDFLLGLQRDAMWRLHRDTLIEERSEWVGSIATGLALLRGVWQNQEDVAGGPFRTRFVYDRERARLYGVQASLFAPGRPKHAFMLELAAIQASFRLVQAEGSH